jgi:CRP/FNR family transcriptional regulator, cyclic AMP receptor protein
MPSEPAHRHELLDTLTPVERDAVLTIATLQQYDAGRMIFLEGDTADALYLLIAGRVAVRASTPEGDVVTLTVLGPGDCFGEVALLGGYRRRTASIVALEVVECLVVGRRDFERLRTQQPAVERLLVEVLVRQVARLTAQVTEALFVPVETRLARRLCDLAVLYHDTDRSFTDTVIPLTQTDLATLAGATRQSCNRILRRLAKEGVLELDRGRTTITDLPRLRVLAGR